MSFADEIMEIEKRLKAADISQMDLCREAEIAHTSWWRWKNGATSPQYLTWMKVKQAADRLTGQAETA